MNGTHYPIIFVQLDSTQYIETSLTDYVRDKSLRADLARDVIFVSLLRLLMLNDISMVTKEDQVRIAFEAGKVVREKESKRPIRLP